MDYDAIGITSAIIDLFRCITYVIHQFVYTWFYKLAVNWKHKPINDLNPKNLNTRIHRWLTLKRWKHKNSSMIALQDLKTRELVNAFTSKSRKGENLSVVAIHNLGITKNLHTFQYSVERNKQYYNIVSVL